MKKREQVTTVEVRGLGQITASLGVLNAISIAFGDSAILSSLRHPDLPGAAELFENYSTDIYNHLDGMGFYDDLVL